MLKLITTITLLLSFHAFNQTNYWDVVLSNDRELALELIEEEYKKNPSLETLLSREIIKIENGKLKPSSAFVDEFLKYDNNAPYLFALWNAPFFFDDYLGNGLTGAAMSNIDQLHNAKFSQRTIKDALLYLAGIKARHLGDFSNYNKYVGMVDGLRDWKFCGVFENLNGSGLETVYPPEFDAKGGNGFNANSNGIVDWYTPICDAEAFVKFTNHVEYGAGVHYAQTFIDSDEDKQCVIRVGNSSSFKLWLNDVLIYENPKDLNTDLDAYSIKVNMPKGTNRLLLKSSEESSVGYFIVRITDDEYNSISSFKYSPDYKDYNNSTEDQIAPEVLKNEFYEFFKDKTEISENFLYAFCLIKAYLRNSNYVEARKTLDPWLEKYGKSSLLRILNVEVANLEGNNNLINEMRENIKNEDPDYHYSLMMRFSDVQELFRMSFSDMSQVLDAYAASVDIEIIKVSTELIKSIRKEDKKRIRKSLDELIELSFENGNPSIIKAYASIYARALNDESKTQKIFEKMQSKYYDVGVIDRLVNIYDNQNQKSKSLKLLEEKVDHFPSELSFFKEIVGYMHYMRDFKGSMKYIDQGLKLFPYSFVMMEYKGDALLQTGASDEAVNWYKKSLHYNSGNSDLRRKIRDIQNQEDIVENFKIQEIYDYIKTNKGSISKNNYGYNILLDEIVVELNEEAGGRTRVTYLYEITSEKGVDRLKEYNLGLYGSYDIIKSEVVKADGKIVPGERNGSSMVFNGLQPGDFIYIDYQMKFNGYGRFFRDFIDDYQFTSNNPVKLATYTLISPNDIKVNYEVLNGELEFKESELGKRKIYNWTLKDHPGLAQSEDYMPKWKDVNTMLHISTLESWNEIANWYSDLVFQQIEIDGTVEKAFDQIFPDGFDGLSEEQRAEKIYNYMSENLSYSHVNFKQSGYVPQKPAKTLLTEMGDCKDFSTLFVVFAEMAGLKANLVLLSTRDNGLKKLVLPSKSFNHCIVKVSMDGKTNYLELTDKNLPFKALPVNDIGAQILEIPRKYDDKFNYTLSYLDDSNRLLNSYRNEVRMELNEDDRKLIINSKITGAPKSYTADIFDNDSYELIEKKLVGRYQSNVDESSKIDTFYNVVNKKDLDFVSYTAEVSYQEKTNKIGKYYVLKVPFITNAYTANVVAEEERSYPIDYLAYENSDEYITTFEIVIPSNYAFVELPENKEFSFKDHTYSRKYEAVSSNILKVTVIAHPSNANIEPEDFKLFKDYVNKILEAKDEFIAFQ